MIMKKTNILTILLLLILVGCSSVKNDTTDYKLKNDILYYKNEKIGYLQESKSNETDEEVIKNYSLVLYDNINKDIILREDIINYFFKKYSDNSNELEVYTTIIK